MITFNNEFNKDYRTLLSMFLDSGYHIKPLTRGALEKKSTVYLRHDVDFDCERALDMASTEAGLGVYSTYFFMLTSDAYNLFSERNMRAVKSIRKLGHMISVHFDPCVYDDFVEGLLKEIHIFESVFEEAVDLISIHRPNDYFINLDSSICGIEHTYQSKYRSDLKYISDSQGRFRYGDPFSTVEFAAGKSFQLLIHPLWWTTEGRDAQTKMETYLRHHFSYLSGNASKNCTSFKTRNKK